jgi:CheY-like chemotaxis protein
MRVLVADDDSIILSLYEQVLELVGHEAVSYGDGTSAWEAFQKEAFPMAVLDWNMPGIDGVDLCRRIRATEKGKATFILMITAREGAEALRAALDAGADDFIAKPLSAENLSARLTIAERRMETDAARRRAEFALARAQWLAGIGETSLAVQHEINNPLASLIGGAYLLESIRSPEEQRELVKTVAAAAKRISDVVQRLANLKDPKSVEYLQGSRMIDLSSKNRE